MTILENLVPPNLDFYRVPVTLSEAPQVRVSPSIRFNSVISAAAAAAEVKEPQKPEATGIYGSVTTMDIAANIKAILAEDEDGVRVVLSPEDITFVEETSRKNGVKQLGIFEIEIRLDDAPDAIRRTIRVNAQD
jgi:ribosomal protein L9